MLNCLTNVLISFKSRVVLGVLLLGTLLPIASAQLTNREIYDRKSGKYRPDKSYIYRLPYEQNVRFLFVQGANSSFSHQGELSFDFKMKPGSGICAARDGVVIEVKMDSDRGGLKNEYLSEGNHIIIRHHDGSKAMYWHLQKNGVVVHEGDSVMQGQLIGYSGNTGYSAFPHLHFQVVSAEGKELLPRFLTLKGIRYIRPGRWYKCVN